MATGPFHTIRIGTTGAWHDLPVGSFIENWRQTRKKNIHMIPKAHGGINTADRKFQPQVLVVGVELYDTSTSGLHGQIEDLLTLVAGHEGDQLQVYDEQEEEVADEWDYDELNDSEVVWTSYSKRKVATVYLYLDCLMKPWLIGTFEEA